MVVDEDIITDPLRLNQVLLNILSNAIKFTPTGGMVSIRIAQKPGAPKGCGNYEFRIKDNGIGMSQEFAQRIFEPFERERTSTVSKTQGTGLGMSITKSLVDMMGGTITVESEPEIIILAILNVLLGAVQVTLICANSSLIAANT